MYQETKELPVTETQPEKISWDVLDRFTKADEIAHFLALRGFKGTQVSPWHCPLARATGWVVRSRARRREESYESINLTPAERQFVQNFDTGLYPFLRK